MLKLLDFAGCVLYDRYMTLLGIKRFHNKRQAWQWCHNHASGDVVIVVKHYVLRYSWGLDDLTVIGI